MTIEREKSEPSATDRTIRNGMKPSVNTAANCNELFMNPSSLGCLQTWPATVGSRWFRPVLNASLTIRQAPARRGPRTRLGWDDADTDRLLLPSAPMVGPPGGDCWTITSVLVVFGQFSLAADEGDVGTSACGGLSVSGGAPAGGRPPPAA